MNNNGECPNEVVHEVTRADGKLRGSQVLPGSGVPYYPPAVFFGDVPLVDWEELLRAVKQYKKLVIDDCGYSFDKAIAERELLDAIEQVEGLEPEGAGR